MIKKHSAAGSDFLARYLYFRVSLKCLKISPDQSFLWAIFFINLKQFKTVAETRDMMFLVGPRAQSLGIRTVTVAVSTDSLTGAGFGRGRGR